MKLKRKLFILILFLVIGIALFTGVILQTGIESIWNNLRQFSLLKFMIFLALSIANFALYTLRWDIILRKMLGKHHEIRFLRLMLHRASAFALSYLTPSAQTGGEPLRVMLLEHDNIPAKTATSSVIIDKALELAALLIFIGMGMALALADNSLALGTRSIFGFLVFFIVALVFWFYYSSLKNIGFSAPCCLFN